MAKLNVNADLKSRVAASVVKYIQPAPTFQTAPATITRHEQGRHSRRVATASRVAKLNVNADPESSGCISVWSHRSEAEAITPWLSANAEYLVPRARPGPLDHK